MFSIIKILAACGAGINSSHQIKTAIEEEMKNRGYDLVVDTAMVKDINQEIMENYDIFTPISKIKFSFNMNIPVVEAGPILYRIPEMASPIFNEIEKHIKEIQNNGDKKEA